MKHFTLKDFILYGQLKCLKCGQLLSLTLSAEGGQGININPHDTIKNNLSCDLITAYNTRCNMIINPINNTFMFSNASEGRKFFQGKPVSFKLFCSNSLDAITNCIISDNVSLSYDGHISPLSIRYESALLFDNEYSYQIISKRHAYPDDNMSTQIIITSIVPNVLKAYSINIPYLSRTKIFNKDKIIEKIKTYMTFS